MLEARRVAYAALLLFPGGLILLFGTHSGGFFPDTIALGAMTLLGALVLRVTLAAEPFEGLSRWGALVAGAMGLFALWQLMSWQWSDAPGRAVVEFDRSLLYVTVLVLFGSVLRVEASLRWIVRGMAAAIVAIGTVALITRVLPHLWPTTPGLAGGRLAYPVSYWNTLGLLMAMGIPLCLHLSADPREPPAARVLGTAALPVLACTLLFTFSRGSIAAGIVGVVAYAVLGRARLLPSTLLAAGPATLVAVLVAYDANVLATKDLTIPEGISQGHKVATVVGVCVVVAAVLRLLLTAALDDRLLLARGPAALRRRGPRIALAAAAVAAVVVVVLAGGVPGHVGHTYDRFVDDGAQVRSQTDLRSRLTDPAGSGRADLWRVAIHRFAHDRLKGDGAGSFVDAWLRDRPSYSIAIDAHSLYLEVLAELGLVGFALLFVVVLGSMIGLATLARGPTRSLHGALFAIALTWAIAAGVDWHWENPVVTMVFFVAAGAGLAADAPQGARFQAPRGRLAVGAGCLLACVAPALVWSSQSHLAKAQDAFNAADCRTATREAQSAFSALGMRPDPLEIVAYCDLRAGDPQLALAAAQRAVELQPDDWRTIYNRAVMRAADGQDPRADARDALRHNPYEPIAQEGARRLGGAEAGPRHWRAASQRLGSGLTR